MSGPKPKLLKEGDMYGYWRVIRPSKIKQHTKVLCTKCNTEHIVRTSALRCGTSKQCKPCNNGGNAYTGAMFKTTVKHILDRCNNPKNTRYKDYGRRGIKVWSAWERHPNLLREYLLTIWKYTNMPLSMYGHHGLILDRKDNNKGYYPGNLHFVTVSDSNRNRRSWST